MWLLATDCVDYSTTIPNILEFPMIHHADETVSLILYVYITVQYRGSVDSRGVCVSGIAAGYERARRSEKGFFV